MESDITAVVRVVHCLTPLWPFGGLYGHTKHQGQRQLSKLSIIDFGICPFKFEHVLCQACPQPMHLRSHDLPPDDFPHGHDLVRAVSEDSIPA